jgi:hypothetical protein
MLTGGDIMDARKKKPYAFTADDDFIQRIRAIAEQERRTLSQMIYILLEEALDARAKAAK